MSLTLHGTHYFDLDGPEGNAFELIGIAERWAKQLEIPAPDLMAASTYHELLDLFDEAFKGRVTYQFLHDPRNGSDEDECEDICYVSDEC